MRPVDAFSKTDVRFEKIDGLRHFLDANKRYALVADDKVAALYGYALENSLKEHGFDVGIVAFAQGEKSKSRMTKEAIEDALLLRGMGKESAIIALGGGVTSDLAGFVAATYCRGVDFLCVPTTLLAMVDAAIGGKTGVNTQQGKNLIGAFYPASLVLIDPSLLNTLDEGQWQNGYAEMIKYALIASPALFAIFEKKQNVSSVENIEKCIAIKKQTIEADPYDKGKRRILNFGHTCGHALEVLLDYQIAHGQAVAIGMAFESFLSFRLGYLSRSDYERIIALLKDYGFPLTLPPGILYDELLTAFSRDKKGARFVVLEGIGNVLECGGAYCMSMATDLLKEAYEQFSH